VGYTAGVYDMFHIGHLNFLMRAKRQCEHLVVGVSTDELVLQTKSRTPVIPFEERLEIVRAIRYVDRVVVQDSLDKMAAWERLHFDVMFAGDDWKDTPRWIALESQFEKIGVPIVYFPYTKITSSSILREKLGI
jgi:glycerol-3-phosphate cytidylyltransferase